jgi:hypothetical protein
MTQPRIDWDRDVSLPVSGRTTHIRHRDSAERGVHRKNPATHKMNEL